MGRDILSIPMSTVASEAIFSTRDRILDQYQYSMLPSTVKAIICIQDWIRNDIRGK